MVRSNHTNSNGRECIRLVLLQAYVSRRRELAKKGAKVEAAIRLTENDTAHGLVDIHQLFVHNTMPFMEQNLTEYGERCL